MVRSSVTVGTYRISIACEKGNQAFLKHQSPICLQIGLYSRYQNKHSTSKTLICKKFRAKSKEQQQPAKNNKHRWRKSDQVLEIRGHVKASLVGKLWFPRWMLLFAVEQDRWCAHSRAPNECVCTVCLFCGLSLFAFANKTVKQLRTFLPFSSPTPLPTLQITPIGTEITSTRTRTVSSLQHRICFPAIGTNMLPSHFFVPRYARAEVAAKRTNSFFGTTRNSTATATSTKDKNSSFGPKVFTRVHTGGWLGGLSFTEQEIQSMSTTLPQRARWRCLPPWRSLVCLAYVSRQLGEVVFFVIFRIFYTLTLQPAAAVVCIG